MTIIVINYVLLYLINSQQQSALRIRYRGGVQFAEDTLNTSFQHVNSTEITKHKKSYADRNDIPVFFLGKQTFVHVHQRFVL